jgi:O-antigen ligase
VVYVLTILFLLVMPFAEKFQWHWKINFDVGDFVYLPLLASLSMLALWRRGETPTLWQELPWRLIWCTYGVFVAAAYAQWSYQAGYLGGGFFYQFYRYAWKPMLLYPVTFYMVARPGGIRWVLAAVILTADIDAMVAIQQGRAGLEVGGLWSLFRKNMLAGSFLVPAFFALAEGLHNPSTVFRFAARVSAVLMAAALWYAVSRGAMVGAFAGVAAYVLISPRGWRVAAAVIAVATLVLMIRSVQPDFGTSSNIMSRFTEIGHGIESDNMVWRMRERWPHFIEIVSAHPLLGVGQAVDLRLGTDTNTPHNGYLALMVQSGIPAALCYVLTLIVILKRAFRLTREGASRRVRGWGAAAFAGVVAVAVHNIVETTFESGPAGYSIWIACGLVMGLSLLQKHQQTASASTAAVVA